MAEETTEVAKEDLTTSTPEVPEGVVASADGTTAPEEQATPKEATSPPPDPATAVSSTDEAQAASASSRESELPQEPDAIQPFIDKAFETIQHEVDHEELGKFLRAHIKTFREEWDALSDTAKDAYVHMMTSQLVQRKAAATRIKIYDVFKLPVPSAQTKLFESIKQSQVKPKKRRPVLLMPPNLRPTYSLKK
jgi:hypothetical protein